ncbi:hypothetical protein HELRODRAFT_69268 [Helobdella robusta]|uniref:[Histone H3]-trimethyl-L-lysine(4) demethylase n=1 Tax=Helobdella robusta TaxID=6412 RepID=T1FZS4_HELRO|nr:hypothetical protein HELRODRAFT_69268 [Helobdella robusta]ESN92954.1 hypothetical protein HELRODRAFT_69268 [Helobdella robusta]
MDCEAFVPPPEAPVYEPTDEEFKDPITYIASIRPVAEKFGICRIKPPSHWQPPFAPDPDTYMFTPRIQKLNELEAKSRIKLHFLNHLTKFWHLQHNPLKIPFIENKHLDLYHLRKFVHERDGFHKVTYDFKWKEIAQQLGYSTTPEVTNSLKNYYFKLLLPYDVFLAGTPDLNVQMELSEAEGSNKHSNPNSSIEVDTSKCESLKLENELSSKKKCHELKKLQFYGPGPKTALPDAMPKIATFSRPHFRSFYMFTFLCIIYTQLSLTLPSHITSKSLLLDLLHSCSSSYLSCIAPQGNIKFEITLSICIPCQSNISESICCSVCAGLFHHACLILPLRESSRKSWRCPFCIAKECKRPMPSFGFEQSQCEYSLKTYGLMADKFKSDYFKMSCHLVPCSVVEQEFWSLVNCLEKDVVVEYGADIHTLEFGSGFPTIKNQHLIEDEDKIYITSPWNLNNLPNLEHSLLKYINVDINGMKVPWVYVGMCFSSFAWHIEDHWSYSVNYMHWGEPKTWYGVPGSSASHLEDCMSKNAPELFAQFPDLLHQLTTIMNPTVLQKSGVPIYRTDQHAGEFVITFPRSYHSGFNQGYNCAEAVNFCTADWLPFGHGCIENYRLHKRQCVFSNDEFVFNILAHVNELTQECLYALYQILVDIVKKEKEMREQVKQEGITSSQQESFELLSDDDRQCEYCKTTCFLSAVTCNCTREFVVIFFSIYLTTTKVVFSFI